MKTFKRLRSTLSKAVYLVVALVILCSHNLYLKIDTYFLQPNQESVVSLYNGTFHKSENIITRDRMLDASMIGNGQGTAINPSQWRDKDSTLTQLSFLTGDAGTYVAGVSAKPRNFELTTEKFNSYLDHDGIVDTLAYRRVNALLGQDAVESYEKHVKAIFQVGDVRTEDWKTVLGYPIEFVPQANPYDKEVGDKLRVKLLLDSKALSNQLVYENYTHSPHSNGHSHGEHTHESDDGSHSHTGGQQLRTDSEGIVEVELEEAGVYYRRTIHMVDVSDSDELTHRSKWATLTFEVR